MARWVWVKQWTDKPEPHKSKALALREKFGSADLPFYVLLSPEGEVLGKVQGTIFDKAGFYATLSDALRRSKEIRAGRTGQTGQTGSEDDGAHAERARRE